MTAKATAILVPVAMTCVCKKCLSLNLKEFSLRISLMSFAKCVAGILKFLKDFVSPTTKLWMFRDTLQACRNVSI